MFQRLASVLLSRNRLWGPTLAFTLTGSAFAPLYLTAPQQMRDYCTIYDFVVEDSKGKVVSLEAFRSYPVILVVNTASGAASADRNLEQLQELYEKYKDQGFMILAFPCSQFLNTEPLENKKIASYAKDKGVTFPVLGKLNVNGGDASPLYEWLKEKAPGMVTDAVKWNFTKFLVVNGMPKKRYAPQDAPKLLEDDIVQAILDVGSTKMDSPITKVDKTDLDFPNKEKAPTAGARSSNSLTG